MDLRTQQLLKPMQIREQVAQLKPDGSIIQSVYLFSDMTSTPTFDSGEMYHTHAAIIPSGIVGVAVCRLDGKVCKIKWIVVDQFLRRHGIGRSIMGSVINSAKVRGLVSVSIDVSADDFELRGFLTHCQFQSHGEKSGIITFSRRL